MNKERRKEITDIIEELDNIKIRLEQISSDEQDYYDNMPEGIQMSEKGDRAEEVVQQLDDVVSELDTQKDVLEEAAA